MHSHVQDPSAELCLQISFTFFPTANLHRPADVMWWQRLSIQTNTSPAKPSESKASSHLGMPLVVANLPLSLPEAIRMVECREGYQMTRKGHKCLPCYLQVWQE